MRLVRLSNDFDVSSFDCGNDELGDFLQDDALGYQDKFLANTTLLLDGPNVVTYFSLVADSIRLSDEEKIVEKIDTSRSSFPAIKLARLATDRRFQKRGYGTQAVEFSIGLARHLNDEHRHDGIGCRFVTVDAYPGSVSWYKRFGFIENETKRDKRRETVSLRLDVLPFKD
ncbi:MAG: hypothetical protein C4521_04305 [Actinobacteria bacterium]|nr:MAG: hypothetical protein C4521_04305 [Actinomycetota bacterium]